MGLKVNVNNMPTNCNKYVIARPVDGELWYFSSFDDKEQAIKIARDLDAVVAERE